MSPADDKRVVEEGNAELREIGTFDRLFKIGRHTANSRHHLRETIRALDEAGFSEAADTLIWQVWHRVNTEARCREYARHWQEQAAAAEAE